MLSEEILYQVALTQLDGVGDVLAKNLVLQLGSAGEIFKAKKSTLEKIQGVGPAIATRVMNRNHALVRAEEELRFMERHKVKPLFITDDAYPRRLRHCHDSPVLLYYKGTADLNAQRIVAVVGTRIPSAYGRELTEKLVAEFRASGVLVVSGLAYGIDYIAHQAAWNQELETVGVLAHGLDRIYPQAHGCLAMQMLERGGLLTDYPSKTNPEPTNFPERNRIVAGMCDALVVVESKKEGGSLITATIANSYSRDVFAFPGPAGALQSEGCNGLIKANKAALIENGADLLYAMSWNDSPKPLKAQPQVALPIGLDTDEQSIYNSFVPREEYHIDDISSAARLSPGKVQLLLSRLEFSNVIRSLPGNRYCLNA